MKTTEQMIAEGYTRFSVQNAKFLGKYFNEYNETVLIPDNDYNPERFDMDLTAVLNILTNEDYTIKTHSLDVISVVGDIIPQ